MKRLWLFLKLLFFTADYLHQVYTYQSKGNYYLSVEFVIEGKSVDWDIPLTKFAFIKALWLSSRGKHEHSRR